MGDDAPWQSLYVQISQLTAIVEDLRARQERQSRMAEILASAPEPQVPRPRPRRRGRDRHGLHVVRGAAVLAAAGRWVVRSHAHRALAGGLIMATAAGASLTPDMIQHAPAAQLPAIRHHHAAAHHHYPAPVASAPPAAPALRKRRRADSDRTARPGARVTPSASPSPTGPDPGPTPAPSPLPTAPVPPPPSPSPDPTCAHHGHGCHGGDAAGAAVRVLRGLPGLS